MEIISYHRQFYTFLLLVFECEAIWRMSNIIKENGIITIGHPVTLELLENTNELRTWTTDDNACTFTDPNNASTMMMCDYPGDHGISPTFVTDSIATEIRTMIFAQSPYCYQWYISETHDIKLWPKAFVERVLSTQPDNKYTFHRVWITHVDENKLSPEERLKIAKEPSSASKALTEAFEHQGMTPYLQLHPIVQLDYLRKRKPILIGYVAESDFWEYLLYLGEDRQRLKLEVIFTDSALSISDCFIRPTFDYSNKMTIATNATSGITFVGSAYHEDKVDLIQDPCAPNTVLILTRAFLQMTTNRFASWEPVIGVNSKGLTLETNTIKAVTITETMVFFVTDDGEVISMNKLTQVLSKVASENVLGIIAKEWCWTDILTTHPIVTWWSSTELFGADKNGEVQDVYDVPDSIIKELSWERNQVSIYTVAIHAAHDLCGILVQSTSRNEMGVVHFSLDFQEWTLLTKLENVDRLTNWKWKFSRQPRIGWILYSTNMAYSYFAGSNPKQLIFDGQTTIDNIKQVEMNYDGPDIILDSSNIIYAVSLEHGTATKMYASELALTSSFVWIDMMLAEVYYIFYTNDKLTEKHYYAFDVQLLSKAYPDKFCPYKSLEVSHDHDFTYLDMNEVFRFSAKVISKDEMKLQLFYTPVSFIKITTSEEYATGFFFKSQNFTVTIMHHFPNFTEENYPETVEKSLQVLGYEITPPETAMVCPKPTKASVYLRTGCPPERNLRLLRDTDKYSTYCQGFKNYSFTIPRGKLDGYYTNNTEDLVVHYDFENWGCPVRLKNTVSYVPQLQIFDGDTFVQNMTGDFFLYEIFFHKGLRFGTTNEQVNCQRRPQIFSDFVFKNTTDPTSAWGPENYLDCFNIPENYTDSDFKKWSSIQYQILNSSGLNYVSLPREYDALFIVRVKLLARNLSYCPLITTFALDVHGSVPDADVFLLSVTFGVFVFGVLIALGISYFNLQQLLFVNGEQFTIPGDESDSDG